MFIVRFLTFLALVTGFGIVLTNGLATPNSNVVIRNAPGSSSAETMARIRRSLINAKRATDKVFSTSVTLDRSWNDKFLFKMLVQKDNVEGSTQRDNAGMSVICSTCYIKGLAKADFTIQGDFNISKSKDDFTDDIGEALTNITTAVFNYADDLTDHVFGTLVDIFQDEADWGDLTELPPLDLDLNIDAPDMPACALKFQFDGLEMYIEIDVILSLGATYTFNIFTGSGIGGLKVDSSLRVGILFTIDLIIDVEAEIDIRSGFHLKLDDGIIFNLPMFSKNVSSVTYNGGNFEFLPVSITSGGVTLNAILRLGMSAGFELDARKYDIEAAVGVVSQVWVDVAQLKTSITPVPDSSDDTCQLHISEEYVLAIGAGVGAYFQWGKYTWGPVLEDEIPIYSTMLAETCIRTRSAIPATTSANVKPRQASLTTTTKTKVTHTVVQCLSTGLINCPNALQKVMSEEQSTILTAVLASSGADPDWTAAATVTAFSTIPFNKGALRMSATSGPPVSYIPPPPSTITNIKNDVKDILAGSTGGVSNKIIIGVSVGVGVPFLIGIIFGIVCCSRRRKRAAPGAFVGSVAHVPAQPLQVHVHVDNKKDPAVNVVEYRS